MEKILERFIEYVKIDTTSDPNAGGTPSTKGQIVLANKLKADIESMGIKVNLSEKGYLMARLKGNVENAPTVGFISHLDTAPDCSGANVNPQIHRNYQGFPLEVGNGIVLDLKDNPDLTIYKGHSIVTTDGTTLLGGDDKGGIAAIMTAVEEILADKDMQRGDVVIGFTPDEEIGKGGENFDVQAFGADFAFTVDGETMGEFNYETFNAAEVIINIKGHNVHPGNGKNKMINASEIAADIINLFPEKAKPEHTEGYEGFFHLCEMSGSVEEAKLTYIIRDFNRDELENKKKIVVEIVDKINEEYGKKVAFATMEDEYYNMKEVVEKHSEIVDIAKKAYENCGIEFNVRPIRGGTDGSKLSFKGLPSPNIFVGGNNFHSLGEFLSVEAMTKAKDIIVEIVKETGKLRKSL